MLFKNHLDVVNRHSFVTGGSQGLGLALAIELVELGSHVTICARNEKKLIDAVSSIEKHRAFETQLIQYVIGDVSIYDEANRAINDAISKSKDIDEKIPSQIFCCAGCSTPGWFNEAGPETYIKDMNSNYFSSLWTIKCATKHIIDNQIPNSRVVITSSVLGFPMGLPGYSSYTPSKHALRGLGDTLRTELKLYGISTHVYFPGTIYSPGYDNENLTKPDLTKKIEGAADGLTPKQCALALLSGINSNQYQITSDFVGSLIKNISRGVSPMNNVIFDTFFMIIGLVKLFFYIYIHIHSLTLYPILDRFTYLENVYGLFSFTRI